MFKENQKTKMKIEIFEKYKNMDKDFEPNLNSRTGKSI